MTFSEWLLIEMKNRDISQAELSKLSGVTPAQISRIISGTREPGTNTLTGIAKAFKLSPEFVFEKAGVLPPTSTQNLSPLKRALMNLAKDMPDSDIEMLIALLEQRQEHYKKNPSAKPAK